MNTASDHCDFDNHERVICHQDDNLNAIIAIHNTTLGPAVGGCRMFPYATHDDAMTDVLRLSRGMTYKSALAGLPLGGGKSVIIGDPGSQKTTALLHAMGDFVQSLGGSYVAAEDSGTSVADIARVGERTRFISGVQNGEKHGGDPSPMTAYGVYKGIEAAVRHRSNLASREDRLSEDRAGKGCLQGIQVAVQGVVNVGFHLTRLLIDAGARVTVTDVSKANLARVRQLAIENVVSPEEILSQQVDVLAPCAMAGAINKDTVPTICAGIIAGAANNQLLTPDIGWELSERGILYAPDYVINAGGIIDVYYQRTGSRDVDVVHRHVDSIAETLHEIFVTADRIGRPTSDVANTMAASALDSSIPLRQKSA